MSCSKRRPVRNRTLIAQMAKSTPTLTSSYRFKWSIENFSKVVYYADVCSPEFSPSANRIWYGIFRRCKTGFDLYIEVLPSSKREKSQVPVRFVTSLSDVNGKVHLIDTTKVTVKNGKESFILGLRHFQKIFKNLFSLKDDVLIIEIYIEIFDSCNQMKKTNLSYDPVLQSEASNTLANDLKKMFETSIKTDVILNIQNQELKAHEAILRSRSIVFDQLFEQKSQIDGNNVLKIEGFSFAVMKELLHFIYSARVVEYEYDFACQIYEAACRYSLLDLRKVCSNILLKELNDENLLEILVLAKRNKDDYVLKKAKKYAVNNCFRIFSTIEWRNFVQNETFLASEIVAESATAKIQK